MKNIRKTTIRDVAERAHVSISTVSNALRGAGYVSEATQARIDDAVSELGYYIDKNARNLRSGRSHVIGVILHHHIDIDGHRSPFLSDMVLAITHQVAKHGYDALFREESFHDDWYNNSGWYSDVESGRVDGFILLGGSTNHQHYLQRIDDLNTKSVPFVEWEDAHTLNSANTRCGIGIDGRHAAYTAVRHLLNLGKKQIAFIGFEDSPLSSEMNQRRLGYLTAMKELGNIDAEKLSKLQALIDVSTIKSTTSFASAQRSTQKLLDQGVEFDAIFALTDLMAMAAINTLRHNGLNVPEDVAIVGFDNISAADYFNPPLTTISQNIFGGGALLVDKLIDLINGVPTESVLLPSKLIIRESCGASLNSK